MIRIKEKTRLRALIAIAVVLAVLFVLIAPSFNLAPSALRASRAAQILFLCLVFCVSLMAEAVSVRTFQYARCREFHDSYFHRNPDSGQPPRLLDLNCTRLC
jgi:hypothetical protein